MELKSLRMPSWMPWAWAILGIMILWYSLGKRQRPSIAKVALLPWRQESLLVLQLRHQKDSLFRIDPQSPIEDKTHFQGLSYYPLDASWVWTGKWFPKDSMEITGLWVTQHPIPLRLWVYKEVDKYFIAFIDSTCGKETYEGGRYVPLFLLGDSLAWVDFNRAYFPYCAYSPRYICLPVPEGNVIPLFIRAGERYLPK